MNLPCSLQLQRIALDGIGKRSNEKGIDGLA
jgi:hypothetical protein